MNWSPRFCASLSVRLRRFERSREIWTSPPWPSTFGSRSIAFRSASRSFGTLTPARESERRRAAVLLVEQRREQVHRLDELVVRADGEALRVGERLLEFGGQAVEPHHGLRQS